MNKSTKKLRISSESIRVLTAEQVKRVAGGKPEDPSFVYQCTAPWSANGGCAPTQVYVCA